VPYKDPETRRRYDREYKQRLRAQRGLTNPDQTPGRKAYICLKYPHLRLSGLVFRDGWFITDDPQAQPPSSRTNCMGRWSLVGGWSPI